MICPKKTTRYIEVSLYRKTAGLLKNSYRKRALDNSIISNYDRFVYNIRYEKMLFGNIWRDHK